MKIKKKKDYRSIGRRAAGTSRDGEDISSRALKRETGDINLEKKKGEGGYLPIKKEVETVLEPTAAPQKALECCRGDEKTLRGTLPISGKGEKRRKRIRPAVS